MTNKKEVIVIDYSNFSAVKMAANDFIREYGENAKFCGLVVQAFEYDKKNRTIYDKRGGEFKPWLTNVNKDVAEALILQQALMFNHKGELLTSGCVGYMTKDEALSSLKARIDCLYANEGRQLEKIKKAEDLYASIKFETI